MSDFSSGNFIQTSATITLASEITLVLPVKILWASSKICSILSVYFSGQPVFQGTANSLGRSNWEMAVHHAAETFKMWS